MIEAYPLQWPLAYKRTPSNLKAHATFKTAFAQARDMAIDELNRMGAKNIIISSNVPLRRDGLPYAVPFGNSKSITDDTGIAVYFDYGGETKVLCCDAFICLDDNMQAIRKTIEALRGIERWQVSEMLSRAFTGFKALPESTEAEKNIWDVLELRVKPDNVEKVKEAYRKLAQSKHPDKPTGSHTAFTELQEAYSKALKFY